MGTPAHEGILDVFCAISNTKWGNVIGTAQGIIR